MCKKIFLTLLLFVGFTIATAQKNYQSYYNDVNLTKRGIDLKDELATKITATHTNYLSYKEVWGACKAVDKNPDNSREVLLIYGYSSSGKTARTRSINSNGGGRNDWNREHSYAKSLGTPNLGTSGPGADSHHLRAADVGFNSNRGSLKFTNGSGNAGRKSGGWYPGDEWKGDVARMMMYMYLRYGRRCLPKNVAIGSRNSKDSNMINILLEWNAEDPVSDFERQRNAYHDSNQRYAQGNRNPFIDNPYLATLIWGGKKAQDFWSMGGGNTNEPSVVSAPSNLQVNIIKNSAKLTWTASTTSNVTYKIYIENGTSDTTKNNYYNFNNLPIGDYKVYVYAQDTQQNKSNKISNSFTIYKESNEDPIKIKECGKETFELIKNSSSSYSDIEWTGDNNIKWTANSARTDLKLNGKTITLGSKGGKLTSENIDGGISSFTVTTKRVYSGGSGSYKLYINNKELGKIIYSDKQQKTTISDINIENKFTIEIRDNSGTNRVSFDDISWTCYSKPTAGLEDIKFDKNFIKIYPNPTSNGSITVYNKSNIEIKSIKLYSIIGKLIYNSKKSFLEEDKLKINKLKKGIYLLITESNSGILTKKVVVK